MRYCNSFRLTWILSHQNKLEVGQREWVGGVGVGFRVCTAQTAHNNMPSTWSFFRWWQAYVWQRFSLNGHCSWRLYDLCVSAGCTVPHSYRAAGLTRCQWNDSLLAVDSTYVGKTGALEESRCLPANVDGVKTQIMFRSTVTLIIAKSRK